MEDHSLHTQWDKIFLWIFIGLSFTGINIVTIGKAMLTPFHLLMGGMIALFFMSKHKKDFVLPISLCFLTGWVILINVLNYPEIRITSFIYSIIYFIEFFILFNLRLLIHQDTAKKAFIFILYAYGINLFLGTILLSLQLELPIIKTFIRTYTIVATGEARPMGFSSEPSYAGFILGVAYLSYNYLHGHVWDRATQKLGVVYIVSVLLLNSAYGFLYLGLNLIDGWIWVFKKGSGAMKKVLFLSSFFLLAGVGIFFQKSANESIQRIKEITEIFTSSQWTIEKKMKKFQEVDASGFARVGPSYLLYVKRSTYDLNMWQGNGAGTAGVFLPKFLAGILVEEGANLDSGILPSFIIDYGMIGLGFLFLFLGVCFYNLPFVFWMAFALILPNANINTQLFWYGIIAFLLVSNFINKF